MKSFLDFESFIALYILGLFQLLVHVKKKAIEPVASHNSEFFNKIKRFAHKISKKKFFIDKVPIICCNYPRGAQTCSKHVAKGNFLQFLLRIILGGQW